jgi:hypothetical protein
MARATDGTPVFTDDSGVRRVSLQLVAGAVAGVFVLAVAALAVSLVLGVPLPGLDGLVPGRSHEHRAIRDTSATGHADKGPNAVNDPGRDAVAGGGPVAVTTRAPSARRIGSGKAMNAIRTPGSTTTRSGGSGATSTAPASAGPTSTNLPSATPSPQASPGHEPSTKPRNPKAATPTRGNSAFSNARANRAATSTDPSTAPGKSGTSPGKSGTGGSG